MKFKAKLQNEEVTELLKTREVSFELSPQEIAKIIMDKLSLYDLIPEEIKHECGGLTSTFVDIDNKQYLLVVFKGDQKYNYAVFEPHEIKEKAKLRENKQDGNYL